MFKRVFRRSSTFLLTAVILAGTTGCSTNMSRMLKSLPEDDQEFVSKVRFIITGKERKKFISLSTAEERARFRKQFWEMRDPTPETDENEFKERYFARIEEANKLFADEGRHGWLSDRGRVYILLGPPETKRIYPTGYRTDYNQYVYPTEVWFYGEYPIIFYDRYDNGTYILSPLSARHVGEINKAQMSLKPAGLKVKDPFNFKLDVFKQKGGVTILSLNIPYKNFVFDKKKKGKYEANLKVTVNIKNKAGKSETMNKDYHVELESEDLDKLDERYIIKIPLKLKKDKYEVDVVVKGNVAGDGIRKKIRFSIKD